MKTKKLTTVISALGLLLMSQQGIAASITQYLTISNNQNWQPQPQDFASS